MVRYRKRTTERGKNFRNLNVAAERVLKDGLSIRQAAKDYSICHVSLSRYLQKIKAQQKQPKTGYNPHSKMFTSNQEERVTQYMLKTVD